MCSQTLSRITCVLAALMQGGKGSASAARLGSGAGGIRQKQSTDFPRFRSR